MVKEFDDILEGVGSYGRYQKLMTALVIIPTSLFISVSVSIWVFVTVVPEGYWCQAPGLSFMNYTNEEWKQLTVPKYENGTYYKCQHYEVNINSENEISINKKRNNTDCNAFNHDRLQFDETIATAKGWLCEKELYSTHVLSITMASNAVGTFVLPMVADKVIGRKKMFFIALAIHLIFVAPVLFIDNYGFILATKFLSGLAFQTNYQMPFIIGLELMAPEKRALTSFFSFVAWTFGMCLCALTSWLIPNWWYLVLLSCLPFLGFFFLWWFLPESPRWLLARGRLRECCDILITISKYNGTSKKISEEKILEDLKSLSVTEEFISLKDLLNYPRVLLLTSILVLYSFTAFVGYGCLIINVKILPDNYFLGFFVLSLCELPSNILGALSCHYLGRRFTAIVTPLLTLPFAIAAGLIENDPISLLAITSVIKIFYTEMIFFIYLVTTELLPTPMRSTGMGVVILSGMIGIVTSPYIMTVGNGFHYWAMVVQCTALFLLALPFPETLGLPLPQTYAEANNVGRNRPLWTWINHWNKKKYL